MHVDEEDPLLDEVIDTAMLVVREETSGGALPLDVLARIIRAAVVAFQMFSERRRIACAGPLPPEPNPN